MQAEYFLFNHSGQGKIIKEVSEVFPHICVAILSQTLIIETIHLRDLTRLMISTEDGNTVLVSYL
jgi:hypothetical protein